MQAAANQGSDSERSSRDGPATSYQDSIKAQYKTGEAGRFEESSEALNDHQEQHNRLVQDEQV